MGGGLRFAGLDFGLPLQLRPDEQIYTGVIRGMVARGDLDPRFYAYPGLAFLLDLGWLRLVHGITGEEMGDAASSFQTFLADESRAILLLRILSASLGTLTLLVTFGLGRELGLRSSGGRAAGLLAALFLSVAFLHVRDSHFGVVDVPLTFVCTAGLWALVRAARSGRTRWLLLAALLAGVATAMKYLPALLAVPLVVVVAGMRTREGKSPFRVHRDHRTWLALLLMAGTFLTAAPRTLLSFEEVRADLANQARASLGLFEGGPLDALSHHLRLGLAMGLGWPLLAVALLAMLAPAPLVGRGRGPLVVFVLLWMGALALLTGGRPFVRYCLPLLPILAALAGSLVAALLAPRWNTLLPVLLLPLLVAPPLYRSLAIDDLFLRPSTYEEIRRWLRRKRPPARRIAFYRSRSLRVVAPKGLPITFYDPPSLAHGAPSVLVVMSHPHRLFRQPMTHGRILAAARRSERVADFRALSPERPAGREPVFEQTDHFLYPLDGFSLVERGGPDIEAFVIDPETDPQAPRAPAPRETPLLGLLPPLRHDSLRLAFGMASGNEPAGYRLRLFALAEDRRTALPGPIPLSPADSGLNIVELLHGPGTYEARISGVSTGAEGPRSEPLRFVLPAPPE